MTSSISCTLNYHVAFIVVITFELFLMSGQPVFGHVEMVSNATPATNSVVVGEQDSVESDLLQTDLQREDLTRNRVVSTGIAGGGVLSLLLVIFGYLRLNHATRGFYSRRLQIGAASAVILIAFACYFLIAVFN